MNAFSTDTDLMKFEPNVFGSWFLSSQVLCGGSAGIVAGTQFTASGVDFTASGVASGDVIWLASSDESLKGAFEIVEALDATHLTVSVVRIDNQQSPIPVGAASGLTWRIVSYAAQRYEILWHISQRLGLSPGAAGADFDVDDIVNPDALRQAAVFGTLMLIFQTLYEGTDSHDIFDVKNSHYRMRYAEAVARVRVQLDTNDDTTADRTLRPDVICLVRK